MTWCQILSVDLGCRTFHGPIAYALPDSPSNSNVKHLLVVSIRWKWKLPEAFST
jgi:hypothetical protein